MAEPDAGFVQGGHWGTGTVVVRHNGSCVIAARIRSAAGAEPIDVSGLPLDANALSARLEPGLVSAILASRAPALAALAAKYDALAQLRLDRERIAAAGRTGFAPDEAIARKTAFRAIARQHPGALRELDAHDAATLAARARAVRAVLSSQSPIADLWIRVVLDLHQTLAVALAARRVNGGNPGLMANVWAELATRYECTRAELTALVFGA